jgi:hypothetical protein
MYMIFKWCRKANMALYLRVLSECRMPRLDPDARFDVGGNEMCILHFAVSERPGSDVGVRLAMDPYPKVVDELIRGLGASPDVRDALGRTALDIVTAGEPLVTREHFNTDADYAEWRARVDETMRILEAAERAAFLRRVARDSATMMSAHPRLGGNSSLRLLEPGVVRRIAELSHTAADAGDML